MRTHGSTLAAVALVACMAGCGGGGQPRENSSREVQKVRDANLNFARCMRENGVDMPDPKMDENGVTIEGGGGGAAPGGQPFPRRFRAAERKCRSFLADAEPPQLSGEQQREFRERALAHAKCMRDHGVDFPDPKFQEGGGVVVDIGPGSGLEPDSPAFQRAQRACRELMGPPGGGS